MRRLAAPGERASARRRTCRARRRAGGRATRAPGPARCAARGTPPRASSCERASSAPSSSTPCSRRASGSAMPSRSRQRTQLVLVAHRAGRSRRAEERAAEARALLVGPVDEPHRHRRLTLRRDPPQHLDARPARSGSRRASRRSAPSRGGRRSARPGRTRPRSVNHWLPASSISSTAPVAASFARKQRSRAAPRSPSTQPAARRFRRPSARAAPRARRPCARVRVARQRS